MNHVDLLTTLIAAGGHAEGEAHFNLFEVSSLFVNFLLFVGFLAFVLKKPLQTYLETRRSTLKTELEKARQKQAEAEKRLAEYEHKLSHLEEEVERIVSSFRAQGEADRRRLEQDADRAIERLVREVDFTIQQESLKAQASLRAEAVEQTIRIAERLVKERLGAPDHERLAKEYMAKLHASEPS